MLHHNLSIEERRLISREGSREWAFTHERDFRWFMLLLALAIAVTVCFALSMWLNGARMLP